MNDYRGLTRRQFVQGLLGTGVSAALLSLPRAWAGAQAAAQELAGTQIALHIGRQQVNYTGRNRFATTINQQLPAPILRLKEGQQVTFTVTNHLTEPSSIHWHGLLLPYQMDGVPGLSFAGIAPNETFTYRFPIKQSGTYWYHSHSGFQEQTGMYGALIIDPAKGERYPADRDYVVLLSDWTDHSPEHIFATLLKQSNFYNYAEPTLIELIRDVKHLGLRQALEERQMWNQMRMSASDLADVSGAAYTYLMNGNTTAGNWSGLFRQGETVKLRLINGSAMTYFDFRIPGLTLTVVAVDGQDIEPITVDELRLATAETYDVIVTPSADRAWTLFAQAMDRTGFVAGTLTPQAGLTAPIPTTDARQALAMTDMMGSMTHAAHGEVQHNNAMHTAHEMPPPVATHKTTAPVVHHAASEYRNPTVDARVNQPRTNLDDPGVGLRQNGRRVLTYADLHTLGGALDLREPAREVELHLTGNMHRYTWSFNGVSAMDANPLQFRFGERLRLVLVNDTMMNHPIHLHGMWSELVDENGHFLARKHTINVQPAQRVCYDVSADALGRWAYHCHLLYHMGAGMFREVVVS